MVPSNDDEKSKLKINILQLDAALGMKLKSAQRLPISLPLEVKLGQVGLSDGNESEDFTRTCTPSSTISTIKTFVSLYKLGITFGGAKQVERVEDLARARCVSHSELLQSALELLKGEPLIFYRPYRDSFHTWSELCVGLREEIQKLKVGMSRHT